MIEASQLRLFFVADQFVGAVESQIDDQGIIGKALCFVFRKRFGRFTLIGVSGDRNLMGLDESHIRFAQDVADGGTVLLVFRIR